MIGMSNLGIGAIISSSSSSTDSVEGEVVLYTTENPTNWAVRHWRELFYTFIEILIMLRYLTIIFFVIVREPALYTELAPKLTASCRNSFCSSVGRALVWRSRLADSIPSRTLDYGLITLMTISKFFYFI